jgi:hypothetical protein
VAARVGIALPISMCFGAGSGAGQPQRPREWPNINSDVNCHSADPGRAY